MNNDEQTISEATGFDQGDMFKTPDQVREYFTVSAQRDMFDDDAIDDQDQLDAWAGQVIEHGWHMVKPNDAVEVVVISRNADARGMIIRCLASLHRAGVAVWQERGEGIVTIRLSVRPADFERAVEALRAL